MHRGERGQTMIFGALSLFLLVSFAALILNVGVVVSHRAEMQNAADAAARTGALTEANFVSTIAFLNDGMAYLYYNMIRYATNVTVFGVLAELKEAGPAYPSDFEVGVTDPVGRYEQAFGEADQWIPRCQGWLNSINRVERAMALSGTELIKREIRRTAVQNALHPNGADEKGVEALALFPDFTMLAHSGTYLRLDIDQIEPNNGWHIESNTGYLIDIRRLGDDHWKITSSDGTEIEVEKIGLNHYLLTTANQQLEIERPTEDHVIVQVTGDDPIHIDCRLLDGLGWAVSAVSPDQTINYQPFPQGGYQIECIPGGTVAVQTGPNGQLQTWNGSAWVPVPGATNQITVGGQTIPIYTSNTIQLPNGASLDLPDTVHIGPVTFTIPDTVQIGNTSIQLRPDSVRITAYVAPVWFIVDDSGGQPYLEVNGLSIRDADGRWRVLDNHGTRHRLQWPDHSDNFWIYEYVSNASYLLSDSMQRLALHAVEDSDPAVLAGQPAAWMEWFNPATGNLVAPDAYHQTRPAWDPHLANYPENDPEHPPDSIRRYASDMFHRDHRRYVSLNLNAIPRPMRLTDEFLMFGINVALWRQKDTPILEGQRQGILRFNAFDNPDWGYFAVASARAAFLDNSQGTPQWRTTFDTSLEVADWVETSYQNLYEPVWTGILVSTDESVKSEHIDCIPPDTGTSFVWRGLSGGTYTFLDDTRDGARWHDPDPPEEYIQFRWPRDDVAERFRNMRNRSGAAFDHTSPDLPDAIDH